MESFNGLVYHLQTAPLEYMYSIAPSSGEVLKFITEPPFSAPSVGLAPADEDVAGAIGNMIARIEEKGWTRGQLVNTAGFCMLGSFVYRNGFAGVDAYSVLREQQSLLGLAVGEVLLSVMRDRKVIFPAIPTTAWNMVIWWNDAICPSREDALSFLREAYAKVTGTVTVESVPAAEEAADSIQVIPDFIPDYLNGQWSCLAAAGV